MPSDSTILPLAIRVHDVFVSIVKHLQPFVLLLIRLAWGWEMLESGYGHLTHFQKVVDFFQNDLHIPFPHLNAAISSGTELVGGALLLLGLGSRFIAIPLVFNFCVAIATAGWDNVKHIFSQDPSNIIDDKAFPFLVASLVILAFGPGCFSLDALISRLVKASRAKDTRGFPVVPR